MALGHRSRKQSDGRRWKHGEGRDAVGGALGTEQEKGLNLLLSHPSTSCQCLPLAESPRSQRITETGKLRSL